MRRMRENLAGVAAIVRRDWLILISYRLRVVTHLLSAFFTVTLFHFVSKLVHVHTFDNPGAYFGFALVGLIILQIFNSTLQGPPTAVRQELVAGGFERFALSPFGAVSGMLSLMLFPLLYSLFTGLAMFIFAGLAFGTHVQWSTLVLTLPVALLGGLSFAPFGVLLMAVVLMFKQALTGVTFIVAGISLISGLYFPIALLPAWMQLLSHVQPFTPAADLMRNVMTGSALHEPLVAELAKLVCFPLVMLPLSILALDRALRVGRRRGTLLEY